MLLARHCGGTRHAPISRVSHTLPQIYVAFICYLFNGFRLTGKYRLRTCKKGTRALFASTRLVPPSANMADTLSRFPVPPSQDGCCFCVCNILSRFQYVLITLLIAASLSRADCTRTVHYVRLLPSGVPSLVVQADHSLTAAANVLLLLTKVHGGGPCTPFIHLRHLPLLPPCSPTIHAIPIRSLLYHFCATRY